MSLFNLRKRNTGTYTSPFSGVGTTFLPLGILPDRSGFTLHETGFLPHNNWWRFLQVHSPFWRCYYNFKKGHRVVFGNVSLDLTPEHIMLIPDHQLFDSVGTTPVPHFWMAFTPARRIDTRQSVPLLLKPERYELDLIRNLAALHNARGECCDRNRTFHLSVALLSIVLSRPEIRWQTGDAPKMEKVCRHIESHYAADLSIRATAREAGMSHAALIRSFKRYQGVTPVRFLMQTRVRQVADLLVNTPLTIDEIAEQTGFPNRAYLSRVFRKITGVSPASFRSAHKNA
jgi:AraC-like DNA-binding protein